LICRGCPHTSVKQDTFYTLALDIKGKVSLQFVESTIEFITIQNNIEDALKEYVKGEVLDGNNSYFCSTCNVHRYVTNSTFCNHSIVEKR
jgi:ubiquitin C-terminal hydrolase